MSKFRNIFIMNLITSSHSSNYNFTFAVNSYNQKHGFEVPKMQFTNKSKFFINCFAPCIHTTPRARYQLELSQLIIFLRLCSIQFTSGDTNLTQCIPQVTIVGIVSPKKLRISIIELGQTHFLTTSILTDGTHILKQSQRKLMNLAICQKGHLSKGNGYLFLLNCQQPIHILSWQ